MILHYPFFTFFVTPGRTSHLSHPKGGLHGVARHSEALGLFQEGFTNRDGHLPWPSGSSGSDLLWGSMGASRVPKYPIAGWFLVENPAKIDDLGPLGVPPISGKLHIWFMWIKWWKMKHRWEWLIMVYTTYKNGDGWGTVYYWFLSTVYLMWSDMIWSIMINPYWSLSLCARVSLPCHITAFDQKGKMNQNDWNQRKNSQEKRKQTGHTET